METTEAEEDQSLEQEIGIPAAPETAPFLVNFLGEEEVGAPAAPTLQPFDPEPGREFIRATVACVLVGCVAFLLLSLPLALFAGWISSQDLKDVAGTLLSPAIGLAGAAIGFYYATKPTN